MSKKNLSQSITDAWKTAVETGQQLNENKQKREQEVSKIFDSARTDVIQHVLENDHGFYRPDIDPFFSEVDGGMLRRKRLMEQEGTDTGATDTGADDAAKAEEEKKKREEEARKKREELQAQKAIDAGPRAQQTQTGETISNRPETGIAALDQKPKATPGSEEYSQRGGSARDVQTRRNIDNLDISAGEKQDRKDMLSRAQADPDERKRLENMSDEEMRDELNRQQLARIKAERLERDKDKIAAGDLDAEGRMTSQGAQKRLDNLSAAQKRRLSLIDQKIAQREALSGPDDPRVKRLKAQRIGMVGQFERTQDRLQGKIDKDKPADTPAATTDTPTDTPTDTSDTGVTTVTEPTGEEGPMANREVVSKEVDPDNLPPELQSTRDGGLVSGKAGFELASIERDGKLPEQGIVASPKSVPGIEGDVSGVRTSGYASGPRPGRPVTIEVDPDDPSGVSKIVTHSDGRKEITYKDGKIVNYDGSGQEVTGDGAAEQRPALAAKERQRAVRDALGADGVAELERLNKQLSDDSFRRMSVTQGAGAQATAGMTRLTDTQRSEINARLKALADRAGRSVDQLQADFEGRLQAEPEAEPVAGGSGDGTTVEPPASVARQPPKAPPPAGVTLDVANYNPVSKYGVNLFEARKRFK